RQALAAARKLPPPMRRAGIVPKPRPSRLREVEAVLARLEPKPVAQPGKRSRPALAQAKARKTPVKAEAEPALAEALARAKAPQAKQASEIADASPKMPAVSRAAAPAAGAARSGCSPALARSAFLVCSDRRLSALDRRTSSLQAAAMSDADGGTRAELWRTRGRFINWRDRCRNEACIESAYLDRIAEIREIMAEQ
ncbi:MAG: hypothetical protein JWN69_2379, partial [Alphaproteobacteria bacterium]|nr:hypothetical protein [Alphaproteobacteria bacterium]